MIAPTEYLNNHEKLNIYCFEKLFSLIFPVKFGQTPHISTICLYLNIDLIDRNFLLKNEKEQKQEDSSNNDCLGALTCSNKLLHILQDKELLEARRTCGNKAVPVHQS